MLAVGLLIIGNRRFAFFACGLDYFFGASAGGGSAPGG